jgi:hypothetical protein
MRRLPVLPSLLTGLLVLVSNDSVSAAFVLSHHRQEEAALALRWVLPSRSQGCAVGTAISAWSELHGRTRDNDKRNTNPSFWSRRCPWQIRRRTGTGTCILSLQRTGNPAPTTRSTSGGANVMASIEESVADASSQPTSSMEARVTPMTTTKKSDGTSDSPLLGTPLARFNNLVNYERYIDDDDENDQGSVATSAHLEANNGSGCDNHLADSERERSSVGALSAASALPLVVNFLDLMHMAFQSATSPEMQRKRRDFVQQLKRRGGYCVVEMDTDDVEAQILHEMWDLMDRVLVPSNAEGEGESSSTMLRRQVLKRSTNSSISSNSSASDNPGYDFVQTTLVEGSVRPLWIEERHGPQLSQQAAKAYMLLAQLCKAFATVVYSGSSGTLPANATRLMESLLDDPGRSFGGSYHRLCRYLPFPPQPVPSSSGKIKHGDGWGESLRPHADWTISTAIPVSSVAGLEVYEPFALQPRIGQQNVASRRWIRIEQVAHDEWKRKNAPSDGTTTTQCCWNAHYVVVFAGAWLELLTDGDVESTLHRVVSRRDDAAEASRARQRMSAPFFMRPKELVFERTDQVFDDPSSEDVAQLDSTEAVRAMGRFLRESNFLQV